MLASFLQHRLRGDDTALRRPLLGRKPLAFGHAACFEHAFVFHSFGDASHQHVVIDSVEKFLQINVDGVAVTCGDVRLGLGDCLVGTAARAPTSKFR